VDWLKHRGAAWVDVAARGHAEAALESRGEVCDDVAKHIVGDNDIELARVADHLHAEGVDVHVLRGDPGIFGADFFEHSLPETAGVGHRVGLVAHQDFVAWGAVKLGVRGAVVEGVADNALDAFARVDVLLCGDLVEGSLLEDSAGIGVDAFGIFTEDDEIDVFRFDTF